MKSEVRFGLAVGLGYLLGRRKKLGRALTLAAAVAIGRASRNPGGLLRYGQELLESSPQLSNLGRLGGPLASAGRTAVTTAASSGIDALSGSLRSGADALRRRSAGVGRRDERDRDERDRDERDRDETDRDDADRDDADWDEDRDDEPVDRSEPDDEAPEPTPHRRRR
ncbi:hypothetical protein ACFY2R_12155 [Micromonospora olivasterospora]|uniref:Uncharacterized protein n=1 Tax=Micromonospora olivasterospora TaxID=1880 RepID=A0A562I831_MICOL|nr:hypothetical protein [Micromonospora olivasterospora]TWH66885.1 hypothetical protein JD77_01844 [Micromonospora olivasterospora]